MKTRDLTILLAVTFVTVFASGCGGASVSKTNPDKDKIVSKPVNMPVIGITSQAKDGYFVLITMPDKYGQPNGQTNINTSKAKITDVQGKPAKIDNGYTVTVDGVYGENEVIASSVVVNNAPENTPIHLTMSDTIDVPTAGYLEKLLGPKVPSGFEKGWKLDDTGQMSGKVGSVVYNYSRKDGWKLLLMRDPQSKFKFTVTLYGPDKFVWSGTQSNEDVLKSSK